MSSRRPPRSPGAPCHCSGIRYGLRVVVARENLTFPEQPARDRLNAQGGREIVVDEGRAYSQQPIAGAQVGFSGRVGRDRDASVRIVTIENAGEPSRLLTE